MIIHRFSKFCRLLAVFVALLLCAAPLSARDFTVSALTSGTLDKYSAKVSLTVDPADTGKSGVIYVAAWAAGSWCFLDADGAWTPWSGGDLPVYRKATLGNHSINLISGSDARPMRGSEFYLAYGYDQADMKANGAFKKALVIGAPEMITIEGDIFEKNTTTPLKGALIGSSLDSASAVSDADGHFQLTTGVAAGGSTAPYTLTISANGYQTLTLNKTWGDHATGQIFYLSPNVVVNTDPLYGVWKLAAGSSSSQFLGQTLAFVDNNLMTGTDGNCTYIGAYLPNKDSISMSILLNLPDAAACPTNPAGSTRGGVFKVAGGQLTITSLAGNTYIFNKTAATATAAGSWTRIFTTDSQAAQIPTGFVLDNAGNITETAGQCVKKMWVAATPQGDSPLVQNWMITGKGDNGQCVRSIPVGQSEAASAMIIGSVLYLWSDKDVRIFRRNL